MNASSNIAMLMKSASVIRFICARKKLNQFLAFFLNIIDNDRKHLCTEGNATVAAAAAVEICYENIIKFEFQNNLQDD